MTTDEWKEGIEQLAAGEFWEAHESWEALWRELPGSAARESMQALIQFAAACYKVTQVRQGRAMDDMQQGMAGLIGRGLEHLRRADQLGPPVTTWSHEDLRSAFGRLQEFLSTWRETDDIEMAESSISALSRALADRLESYDQPVA